jgi:hypothetical protein
MTLAPPRSSTPSSSPAGAVQHVEEVGVAAGVELVGAIELDAAIGEELRQRAVHDRCPTCDLMSSPTAGMPRLVNRSPHVASEIEKDRHAVDEARPVSRHACA